MPLSRGRVNCIIKLPHLPNTKEQKIVPLLNDFYCIHSHSDGNDWNAIEVEYQETTKTVVLVPIV